MIIVNSVNLLLDFVLKRTNFFILPKYIPFNELL